MSWGSSAWTREGSEETDGGLPVPEGGLQESCGGGGGGRSGVGTGQKWVQTKERSGKGQLVVGVYNRPPDQGEPVDEAFLLQLPEASSLQALVLMGDFNHPEVYLLG